MGDDRPPAGYIDIHTHTDRIRDGIYIYNADATSPIDLSRHERISIGLHPWSLDPCKTPAPSGQQTAAGPLDPFGALDIVEALAGQSKVVAIGECGLDRLIGAPLAVQSDIFLRQLAVAERVAKPLIVHCIRAHNELIRLLKVAKIGVPVVIHGYNNNWPIAEQCLRNGMLLSFGAQLLKPDAPIRAVLARCPSDRFFLETDDREIPIEAIYAAAAACRQMSIDELKLLITANYARTFSPISL